ncbi:MAG: tripartite tricarboxylate transporter TctB family protein [Acetobacteraceae bacterium]
MGKNLQDLLTGLMFMGIGAFALWVGADYPRGTPVRLGTGVFPMILSWGLVLVGAIVFIKGLVTTGPSMGAIAWRPVILIPLAAAMFAFLIEPAGLVVAMLVMMILARFAGDGHSNKEFAIFTVIMLLMGVGIFIWGLEMPLKVFPWS